MAVQADLILCCSHIFLMVWLTFFFLQHASTCCTVCFFYLHMTMDIFLDICISISHITELQLRKGSRDTLGIVGELGFNVPPTTRSIGDGTLV